MKKSSRRNFIRGMALSGVSTICLSGMESFAAIPKGSRKIKAGNNMVILFQGDSITDGNRGRNADLNQIRAFCSILPI